MAEEKKYKVAVYGSLRKGMSNHNSYLKDAEYLGTFDSLPQYNMYSVGDAFPAVTKNGYSSIKMEVYEVNDIQLAKINRLEGYSHSDIATKTNHYNQKEIETPWGEAFWYEYNNSTEALFEVEGGDWVEFKSNYVKNLA